MDDIKRKSDLDTKFLWLQVLHVVDDMRYIDNPATGRKTIQALFDKFEISVKGDTNEDYVNLYD